MTHAPDGKHLHESAVYQGPVFDCECGESFVTYEELEKHCRRINPDIVLFGIVVLYILAAFFVGYVLGLGVSR